MTEQELRQLVREAIARVGVGPGGAPAAPPLSPSAGVAAGRHPRTGDAHPSFTILNLPAGDGPCLIEPAVSCNHCGYCKTYGH